MVLIQPKISSTRFRFLCLMAYSRLLRGSLVDGAAAPCVLVLRYVGSHRRFPELIHEISCVIVLVSAQRHPPRAAWNPRRHVQRASRSAVPVARVSRVSTTSPLRFSINTWPDS